MVNLLITFWFIAFWTSALDLGITNAHIFETFLA